MESRMRSYHDCGRRKKCVTDVHVNSCVTRQPHGTQMPTHPLRLLIGPHGSDLLVLRRECCLEQTPLQNEKQENVFSRAKNPDFAQ